VSRPKLAVADIFRDHGAAWRSANAGHVSLGQLKVMSAIERCRTAALGGHVERSVGLEAESRVFQSGTGHLVETKEPPRSSNQPCHHILLAFRLRDTQYSRCCAHDVMQITKKRFTI
jgi:hypothetical protein